MSFHYKYFFSSLFLLLSLANAQSFIKGKVINEAQKDGLPYAIINVYLSQKDSLLHAVMSDSLGNFTTEALKMGTYKLKIDVLGYHLKQTPALNITKTDTTLNLGFIEVKENISTLQDVIITDTENQDRIKIDKQVYKADLFQAAKGGTATDVLKNMPSVSVNAEGEIRLRGATGFLILLNGKPVLSDANTVLSQIPANSIENIEIITAPSAKYDADGKAGIINITTKKGMDDGFSFTINTQYGLPSLDNYSNKEKPLRYGSDVALNYKKKSIELSLGASYLRNDLAGYRDGDVNTTLENRHTSFPSQGERSFNRRNYALRGTLTYTPNKNNTLSAGFYVGQRRQFRRADITYHNTKTDAQTGQLLSSIAYFNSNLVKKQGDFSLINLDYSHTFSNKSVLSASTLCEYALLEGFTKNLNASIQDHSDTIDYVLNTGNSPLRGFRAKLDYSITLGQGKLESGYQFRYQTQTGAFLYQNAILGSAAYETIPEFSANIKVLNQIHGLYSQYTSKFKKLEYAAGLRYEHATRSFNADKLSSPYLLNLSNLFPSANLFYKLSPKLKIKAGFSKRVQRSTSNELNPYPEREHSETLEQGDPNIKPEFVSLTELGMVRNFKKGSLFATLYNQQINHVVNRVNSVYNDTILNRIYTNAGKAILWGIETGLKLEPAKWWSIYLGGNVYHYSIKGELFKNTVQVKNSALAYSINTNHNFQITKSLSVSFNLNFLSQRPTAQGKDSRFLSPNISIKKTFWKGKLSSTFQWQNIGLGFLPSNEQRISTWGNNFYTTTNYIQEKDVLWINLGYNFKQSKKLKLPNSEFGEKEF